MEARKRSKHWWRLTLGLLAMMSVCSSVHAEVSSSRLSLPKGPGSIEGLASADVRPQLATGSASYSVPIELPPSARGFSPKLSLAYSSGAGVSELGIGWSLSGLPRVVRRTNEGLPHFDEEDTFGLVGLGTPSDLIEVEPGLFRPEYEDGSFLRVLRDVAQDEWRVRTKSGVTLLFGGDGYTEEENTGSEERHVASYLLREQLDLHGNRIAFEWDTSEGHALLQRIVWNDFSKEARNEVVATYETRPDPSTLYADGIRKRLTRRVAHIDVMHGGTLVRRYELAYSDDAHPRLTQVTLVGADGESKLPAARFEYSGAHLSPEPGLGSAQLVSIEGAPGRSPGDASSALVDLNGDALPDLLVAEAGAYRSYINQGGKAFSAGVDWAEAESPSVSLSEAGIQLADVDGDGGIDLLAKSGTSSLRYFTRPSETSFASVRAIPIVPNISFEDPEVRLTDVDGDRRTDAIYTAAEGLYVARNLQGEGWELPELVGKVEGAQELLFSSSEVELCDINGDRLKDICVLRSQSLHYYLAKGRGKFEASRKGVNVPAFDKEAAFRLLDLNGDGWDDLVRVGSTSVWYALAAGEGIYADVRSIDAVPANTDETHVEFVDMNASGTTDILWVNVSGEEDGSWQYLELFPEGRAGLLTRIENGLGKVQRLEYAPAARFAAEARKSKRPWTSRINVPMPVISRISVDAGLADPLMVTEFRYEQGVYDPSERTFAGFGVAISTAWGDETTPSLVTEQHFDTGLLHRGLRGVTRFEETRSLEGSVFSRSTFDFTYSQSDQGLNGRSIDYGYQSAVLKEVVEGNEKAARTTYAEVVQDKYGSVVEERDWGEVIGDDFAVGADETITVRSYAHNEEDWVLGRLATEEVTDIHGRRLRAQRNFYDGPAFEGLPLGEVTRGDITREEVWVGPGKEDFELESSTKYDEKGLPSETRNARGGGRIFEWSADQTSLLAETVKLEGKVELRERATVDARFGNVVDVTTYNGQTRHYEYDAFGRVIKVIEPGDSSELPTIEYRYEASAPLSRVVTLSRVRSGRQAVERSESLFDGLGRKRASLTQDGERWVIAGVSFFDARGNAFRKVDPRWLPAGKEREPDLFADGRSHAAWFDAMGRETRTLSPEGVESTTAYGPFEERHWDGGQSDEASPYEHTPTVTLMDAHGKVIEHQRTLDGKSLRASYERNPLGQLIGRVDPEGNAQRYAYDGRGRLIRLVDADMGEHRMVYDASNNLLRHEHPDGETSEFRYDLADRVTSEDWDGDGKSELTYHYDEGQGQLGVGRLLRVEEPTGFIQHKYDERSQIVQTEYNIEGKSYVVGSRFDAQGRERVHIYPDGSRVELKRNGRGQLSGYGDAVEIEYAGNGLESMRRFSTGVAFENRYDKDQRRRELQVVSESGDILEHLKWDFDDGGNLQSIRDLRPGISEEKDRSEQYSYDNLYRLVGARGTWGNTEWRYSPSGNLLRRTSTFGAQNVHDILYLGRPHAPSGYSEQSISYDARGRMTHDGQRGYEWNGADQLVRVTKGENWTHSDYGMEGIRRVRREHTGAGTQTTHFIDAWSEVREGKLVRYLVHAEKRIAVLASDAKRAAVESAALGVAQKTSSRVEADGPGSALEAVSGGVLEAGGKLGRQRTEGLFPWAHHLSEHLIALLLLSVGAVAAWCSWLRGSLVEATHRSLPAARAILLLSAALAVASCSGPAGDDGSSGGDEPSQQEDPRDDKPDKDEEDDGIVWINELTSADTILLTDLTGSALGEANGLGKRRTEVALYPYGLARYDDSRETNVFVDSPRDRSVGLDHMGARFYSPELGIWTSADPAILTEPEQYVTAEFAAANPYAYANLRPVVAADRDGQFWHLAAGAAAGGLLGAGAEALSQYLEHGKIEDWGRVGSAGGGGIAGGLIAVSNPAAALSTVMSAGAGSSALAGVTERLIASGGKSAGTLTEVAIDAGVGAGSAGIVKGGASLLRKVLPKKVAPPASKGAVAKAGSSTSRFHSAHPDAARPISEGGFRTDLPNRIAAGQNNRFGRAVYLADSPAAAFAERPGGTILSVEVRLGKNLDITARGPIGDKSMAMAIGRGARKHGFDSITTKSVQSGGGVNTVVFDPSQVQVTGGL